MAVLAPHAFVIFLDAVLLWTWKPVPGFGAADLLAALVGIHIMVGMIQLISLGWRR